MTAAKPEVSQKKSFSFTTVWLIPLIAVVLGAWVVVQSYLSEGPEIKISFNTAQSLEAGKTKVRFRNIEMGTVQEIILSEDMQGVTATIKMERQAIPLLGQDTEFWVVRASVGGGSVTGLDTLLSGAYITFSPATSASRVKKFVALEKPPQTPLGSPGLRLVLVAENANSLNAGDPILYKGLTIGRIETLTFDTETKKIRYDAFIDDPFHELVDSSIRFWNISGISMQAGTDGLKVTAGSLETLIAGGVAAGRPPGVAPGEPVEQGVEFKLFNTYGESLHVDFKHRAYYVAEFSQSLKGLSPGAPVEYRGIEIGAVEAILTEDHLKRGKEAKGAGTGIPIAVLMYIEPGRATMSDTAESLERMRNGVELGVANGLRATLLQGNLLSGAKIVSFDYFPDAPSAEITKYKAYESIPTIITGLGGLEAKMSSLLDKLNNLPLESTVKSANQTIAELNKSVSSLRALIEADSTRSITVELQASLVALRGVLEDKNLQDLPGKVGKAIATAQATLAAAQYQLKGDSPQAHQLGAALREVEAAARSLREFLDVMERNPESLIRGKKSQ